MQGMLCKGQCYAGGDMQGGTHGGAHRVSQVVDNSAVSSNEIGRLGRKWLP